MIGLICHFTLKRTNQNAAEHTEEVQRGKWKDGDHSSRFLPSSSSPSNTLATMTTDIPFAPAPWINMRAEGLTFNMYTSASNPPPSSAYDPLERASDFADPEKSGEFAGGIGQVMIVRYKDSPVGPYDELLVIPGFYTVPPLDGKAKPRITRIYVSSAASTFNGRRNWGIPKRVAEFTFTPNKDDSPGYERIEVRLPGEKKPFFAVNLVQSMFGFLSIPLSSKVLPVDSEMVQPPNPKGEEPERTSSNKWFAINPWMRGKISPIWGYGGLKDGEWSDNIDFPKVQPYSLGFWWKEFLLDFPVGVEVGSSKI